MRKLRHKVSNTELGGDRFSAYWYAAGTSEHLLAMGPSIEPFPLPSLVEVTEGMGHLSRTLITFRKKGRRRHSRQRKLCASGGRKACQCQLQASGLLSPEYGGRGKEGGVVDMGGS